MGLCCRTPAPQPSPNLLFSLQKWYIDSGPHSILGCSSLLCPPPPAQLPPPLFLSPAEDSANTLPSSLTPPLGTASQPPAPGYTDKVSEAFSPVRCCLPQSLLSLRLGRTAADIRVRSALCSLAKLAPVNSHYYADPECPNPVPGPSSPRRCSWGSPSFRLILNTGSRCIPCSGQTVTSHCVVLELAPETTELPTSSFQLRMVANQAVFPRTSWKVPAGHVCLAGLP